MPPRWYSYAVLSPGYLLTPFAVLAALFGFLNQFVDSSAVGGYVVGQADTVWRIVTSGWSGLLAAPPAERWRLRRWPCRCSR